MALLKKRYLHQGDGVKHLGTGTGLSEQMIRDSVPNTLSDEEYEQKYNELVEKANSEANHVLENARNSAQTEAQKIITDAQAEAQRILDEEKAKGFELGRKEALAQLTANIQESQNVIKQANAQKNAIVKSAVPEILKLAIKVASQVVKTELASNQEIVMHIVRDAIEKISDNEQVVIKVAQADLQRVRDNKDMIIDLVEAKNLSIVGDKHVVEGGCQIETKLGYIDARVVTKLEMIESALLAVYEEEKVKKETQLKEKADRGEEVDFAKADAEEIAQLMGKELEVESSTEVEAAAPEVSEDVSLDLSLDNPPSDEELKL